jgi:hypothetical protein
MSNVEREAAKHTFEVGLSTMPLNESVKPARHRRKTWKIDWNGSARVSLVSCVGYLEYGEEDALDGCTHERHDWQ